jgi:hypothetical protein
LVGWIIQPAARGSWSSLFCWGTVTSLSVFCVFCLCCVRSLVLFLVQCSCYWRWRPGAATEDEVRARCRNTMISTFVSLLFVRPLFFSFPYGLFPNVLIWLH